MKKGSSANLDIASLSHSLSKFGKTTEEHSSTIIFVLLISMLIYAIFSVQSIISMPDDTDYRTQQEATRINSSFDKDTIKKIDDLKTSTDTTTITLLDGRRNPFAT